MVKCPICDGRGKYANAFGVVGTCHYCKGSGYLVERGRKNMTKQEWLQTATTEQLAEWIAKIVDCDCCPVKRKFCDDNPCKIRFMKWLKQPHNKGVAGWTKC